MKPAQDRTRSGLLWIAWAHHIFQMQSTPDRKPLKVSEQEFPVINYSIYIYYHSRYSATSCDEQRVVLYRCFTVFYRHQAAVVLKSGKSNTQISKQNVTCIISFRNASCCRKQSGRDHKFVKTVGFILWNRAQYLCLLHIILNNLI